MSSFLVSLLVFDAAAVNANRRILLRAENIFTHELWFTCLISLANDANKFAALEGINSSGYFFLFLVDWSFAGFGGAQT